MKYPNSANEPVTTTAPPTVGTAALKHEHPSGWSWRIDVICKQIGWLGTYRRSRVTGYWFAGKHSIHMAGHPAEQAD